MSKLVSPREVKEGQVVLTSKGRFVVYIGARFNKRGGVVIEGVYERDLPVMLKKMRFVKWTYRGDKKLEVTGTITSATVKKIRDMHYLLYSAVQTRRTNNIQKLGLKWNPEVMGHKGRKYFKGAYDVTTMKGEHVKAGDLVMVQFSNGKFEMVMGNLNGATYDPKTGFYLCMSPWKENATPTVRNRFTIERGWVEKVSKPKARGMRPDTLLYLIKRKEDRH